MSSLKKHIEKFEKNFDESLDYKVGSEDVVTVNSDGNIKFFKEQYQDELAEKDRVIENLKQELDSQWLTNKTAFNTKKLYEDKIKKMNIVDSTNLIPTLMEVSKQKQGNTTLDWMSWLEIPESNYLFQINESLARKIFQENNNLIEKDRYGLRGRKGRVGSEANILGNNIWPTPTMSDASDVWTYDTEDIEVVYKDDVGKLINTVKAGASNGGDGEEIKTTINGLYDHIAENCDDWDSCTDLMDSNELSHWYQLKFTYHGTEEDVGGETNSSLKGVGIRMKKGQKITADDWDKQTEGPNDGTTIVSVTPGHTMDMWIYGDHGNEYQQEQHPDFWEQANCTVGEECTVWVWLYSGYNTPTSHEFQLLNGQLYDKTTWGNFSLIRADAVWQ